MAVDAVFATVTTRKQRASERKAKPFLSGTKSRLGEFVPVKPNNGSIFMPVIDCIVGLTAWPRDDWRIGKPLAFRHTLN